MAKVFEVKSDLSFEQRQEIDRIEAIASAQRNTKDAAFLTALAPYLTNEVLQVDADGLITEAAGLTLPTSYEGFAKGAIFNKTDASNNVRGRYQNIGLTTSAVWDLVGTATDGSVTPAMTNIVEARTATAAGLTTGTISANVTHVTVTSDSADKIIILPAPVIGLQLVIHVGATGFELRSSAPATVSINGGAEADAESAIPANSTLFLTCVSLTEWKGFFMDADGDLAKIPAAAAA